jgi:predicted deacylase
VASLQESKVNNVPLVVGSLDVAPGTVGFGSITCAWLADSTPLEIPLIGVNGRYEGPRLWVNSTMHGPEIPGIEVIRRVLREEIDPLQLHGSIVGAPILSPLAYRAATYFTPVDGLNLASVFTRDMSDLPSLTHRMARRVYEAVSACDYIIDLHANPSPALIFTMVPQGEGEVIQRSLELAEAFGVTTIRDLENKGNLVDNAINDGKPSLVLELTSWEHIDEDAVAIGVEGLLNVCSRLGMLDRAEQHIELKRTVVVSGALTRLELFSERGGIVSFTKSRGEEVRSGEVVAIIRNPLGDVEEELRSPADGWLLAYPLTQNQSTFTGETVVYIAIPLQ